MSRLTRILSWIGPPLGMSIAYTVLAITSETDNSGKAWMAIGFGFVVVLWLVFRIAVEGAGLSRALAVGDSERLLAIADAQLARKRTPQARAPFLVYKALAHQTRGELAAAATAIDEAKPMTDSLALLAASVRVSVLLERNDVAGARKILDDEIEPRVVKIDRRLEVVPHHYAHLARAQALAAEGHRDDARAELRRVIDDIRSGAALRDYAKVLEGRL